jgi:glucose-6-phosphate 1-dehydrogenase
LATAPDLFGDICRNLSRHGLITPQARVVLEKPIGRDLASARQINEAVGAVFDEHQIFRIDHYLGKEAVQNLLALRFANALFETLWSRTAIDHVQITVAETIGVEQRGGYYDKSGALRDMVQNHLLQLLCLVAMDSPSSLDPNDVRDEKLKVLRTLKPITAETVGMATVRGQYRQGAINGASVPGYLDDLGQPASDTETFLALKAEVNTWRWAGVPFYLRTGKALAKRQTEVAIQFKQAPFAMFRDTPVESLPHNDLIIHIQPDEGVTLRLSAKVPGPSVHMGGVEMRFNYRDYFKAAPSTGYETLIYDCMKGDASLFQRADNIEGGWRLVQPLLDAWKAAGKVDLPVYKAGGSGPDEADALLARDGRRWRRIDRGPDWTLSNAAE